MRRRPLALLLAFIPVLLLAGCHSAKVLVPPNLRPPSEDANTLEQARQRLQSASPCCSSFADFSYQTPLPWRPKQFDIGVSPVANLHGVHSHFLAFSLPADVRRPFRVALKADLNGRWLHASYLFAPTVVVLDEAFQPIDTRDVQLCEYMGWSEQSSGAFGSVSVDSDKARYLVVYSSGKQQTGDTYWEQSPATFSADAPVQMNSQGSFRIPHGPDGTLWVGLMTHSFQKAVENAVCGKPSQGNGVLDTLRGTLPVPWSRSGS